MILPISAAILIGVVSGIVWERYRWVRACKKKKVIEVDGNLYGVHKVIPTPPAE